MTKTGWSAVACCDDFALVCDTFTGEVVRTLASHEGGVVGAAFSPDDTLVATVGDDDARVWGAATGQQLGAYLGSYPEPLFLARDCSKLVIGTGTENEVRIHPFGACGTHDQLLATALERIRRVSESARLLR